jgi:hypothetical protein
MQISILKSGENRLTDLLSKNLKTKINSFRIGSSAGLTPNSDATQVSGSMVYQGTPDQITYYKVSPSEIVLKLILDHDVGDFNIGNVLIFLDPATTNGPPIPFLWAVLPSASPKNDSNFAAYVVGNRVVILIALWFPYIQNILDMAQHKEEYAQFKEYGDENLVPSVDIEEYDQVSISSHSQYNSMSVLVKDNKYSKWWGLAFTQFVDDPGLNRLEGGIIGQEYGSFSGIKYYDGKHFIINNNSFPKTDGGNNWIGPNEPPVDGGAF